jgi:hypothetical protein
MVNQTPKLKTLEEVLKLIKQNFATNEDVAQITASIANQVLSLRKDYGENTGKLNEELTRLLNDHKSLIKSNDYSISFLRKELDSLSKAVYSLKLQNGKDGKDADPVDTAKLATEASEMALEATNGFKFSATLSPVKAIWVWCVQPMKLRELYIFLLCKYLNGHLATERDFQSLTTLSI